MASINLELQPFPVPNGVQISNATAGKRQDGFRPAGIIPLSGVPREELLKMCEDFKHSVMEAAGYGRSFPGMDDEKFLATCGQAGS